MGRGTGNTPDYIVAIIKDLVAKHGQNGTVRLTGLNLLSVQRYLKGIGYPTPETFQRLADYTGQEFTIVYKPVRSR